MHWAGHIIYKIMNQISKEFPDAQFIEVGPHRLPLNLTTVDQLTSPIRAFFPFAKGVIRVTGKDRKSFLHGLCTADVNKLEPLTGTRTVFTDKNGKVHFDCLLYQGAEEILLFCDPGEEEGLTKHLDFYLIVEDVQLALTEEWDCFYIFTEEGEANPDGFLSFAPQKKENGEARPLVCKREENGFSALLEADYQAIGFELYEEIRPAFELSRAGIDFDSQRLPQEAALEDWVNFTKGCYLGQEPISRIAYRGRVKHKLTCFKALNPVPSGAAIVSGDKELGMITSGSSLKVRGSFYALGYLDTHWFDGEKAPIFCATAELLVDRQKDQDQPA